MEMGRARHKVLRAVAQLLGEFRGRRFNAVEVSVPRLEVFSRCELSEDLGKAPAFSVQSPECKLMELLLLLRYVNARLPMRQKD
jgi:hypothetical protein